MHRVLPRHAQTLYAELLEATLSSTAAAITSGRGSYVTRKVRGRPYLYYQVHAASGAAKRVYLGPATAALVEAVGRARGESKQLSSLSKSLVSAGGFRLDRASGALLTDLSRTGCFVGGAVLVGTFAFAAYQNHFGVRWSEATSTNDVDLAAADHLSVAVDAQGTTSAVPERLQALCDRWTPIFKITEATQPPVAFRDGDLRVDLLTPERGAPEDGPAHIGWLGAQAEPLRYLDYLIADPIPAVLPTARGAVFVYLPQPARFAIHKLIVSQVRADRPKRAKDLRQSEALCRLLLAEPADAETLRDAFTAARARGRGWRSRLDRALLGLPGDLQEVIASSPS